ncbi:ATP-binding cassette domain-containing protein [Streptomyces gamaensis]|uniref:ATP-binding cassette domain-containing protein n=1 Tax=Streptomyces gamaensis TaxID=1763542 RepID=A0ABW0Z787_9ACTN
MIQAIGLTSVPSRDGLPAVDDLTFEAHPGRVTVLLGAPGSGKTSALRIILRLDPGRGIALFRGRSLDRIPHPAREIGVLLGDVPGHPARSARSHLHMLAAAGGLPVGRVDDVLEVVGLTGLADQRIGDCSRGMDRRLGLAAALLGDPHTLVLDEPAQELSPRETAWLHGMLRGYAAQGGAVLVTSSDPKEAARIADQVVTIDKGRLVADQAVADFARGRLRPRVVVHSPLADRLAHVLAAEAELPGPASGGPRPEIVPEGGGRLSVYGSSCAAVGETAHRHGILVHRLAEETADAGPVRPLRRADGRAPGSGDTHAPHPLAPGVPRGIQPCLPAPGPVWSLRYELHRATGVGTGWTVAAASLAVSLLASVLLVCTGGTPASRQLTGWPTFLPLPPAAFGAGVIGALAFGQEFRYPALAPDQGAVPRRLSLLGAKLLSTAVAAVLLALVSLVLDIAGLHLLYGNDATAAPGDWAALLVGWTGLALGCAWAGLLAAGLFRSTALGLLAVLVVPTLVVPFLDSVLVQPAAARSSAGLPQRLHSTAVVRWPAAADGGAAEALRLVDRPGGLALALSLLALLGAYVMTVLRGRPR